jgi:hypothetical protein
MIHIKEILDKMLEDLNKKKIIESNVKLALLNFNGK